MGHILFMKVPSPCEPFGEPLAVPSCEEKGSAEPSDETYFHVKVRVKLQMNLFIYMNVHVKVHLKVHLEAHLEVHLEV